MCLFNLKFNPILCFLNIKTQVYTTPLPRCIYLCPDINGTYIYQHVNHTPLPSSNTATTSQL